MILDLVYACLFASFLTHELDAVKRHEWRVLPLTSWMPDPVGEQVFIWAHGPIVAALLWGSAGDPAGSVRIGLAAFAVVHVGLHWVFRRHPAYEFDNPGSRALIRLTGVLGALYLALVALGAS